MYKFLFRFYYYDHGRYIQYLERPESNLSRHESTSNELLHFFFAQHVFELTTILMQSIFCLTSFFCSTYSYLTGNQLTSKSSVFAYISALEQGCRCVERE